MRADAKSLSALLVLFVFVSLSFAEDTSSGAGGAGSSTTAPPDTASTPATAPEPAPAPIPATAPASTTTQQEPAPVPQPVSAPDGTGSGAGTSSPAQPAIQQQPATGTGAPCPAIAPQSCEFGNKQDASGCSTSECNMGPVSPAPQQPTSMPPQQLPENCKRVMMEGGIEKVSCDAQCPMPPPQSEIDKCKSNQGIPQFLADNRGCNIFECRYQSQGTGTFGGGGQCPSEEERSRVSDKCKSSGMRSIMRNDFNGCLIVDCVSGDAQGRDMQCPPNEEDARIAEQCKKNGGRVFPGFDPRGCRISMCEYQGQGMPGMQNGPDSGRYVRNDECKAIPKEAFEKCSQDGGNLIVKKDERGCPAFADCIMRGDERQVEYESVEEVPDSTSLMAMAFKLESIKIEFDKLAIKTDEIALYYDSVGKRADAERFRKVSSMFAGAEKKIDEIKAKMRSKVEQPTKEDISEIKHDLKYIREVVMKDILYVMLSGDEGTADSSGTPESEKKTGISKNDDGEVDCGTDGFCFNEQLRVCEKAVFYPPSDLGGKVAMHIVGLEDGKCVLKADVVNEKTGTNVADMTCRFPDYVMGLRGPEELMPYCEGSMAEMFNKASGSARADNSGKPFGKAPIQNRQEKRYVRAVNADDPIPDFPQEIAPIGYLLKQFALI